MNFRGVYQTPLLAEVLWTMMAAGKMRKSQFSLYAAPDATCVSVDTLVALSKFNGFLKRIHETGRKGCLGIMSLGGGNRGWDIIKEYYIHI